MIVSIVSPRVIDRSDTVTAGLRRDSLLLFCGSPVAARSNFVPLPPDNGNPVIPAPFIDAIPFTAGTRCCSEEGSLRRIGTSWLAASGLVI